MHDVANDAEEPNGEMHVAADGPEAQGGVGEQDPAVQSQVQELESKIAAKATDINALVAEVESLRRKKMALEEGPESGPRRDQAPTFASFVESGSPSGRSIIEGSQGASFLPSLPRSPPRTVTVKNAIMAVPGKKGDMCEVDVRITVQRGVDVDIYGDVKLRGKASFEVKDLASAEVNGEYGRSPKPRQVEQKPRSVPLIAGADTVFYITDAKANFLTVEVAITLGGLDKDDHVLLSDDIPVGAVFEVTNKYITRGYRRAILEDFYGMPFSKIFPEDGTSSPGK